MSNALIREETFLESIALQDEELLDNVLFEQDDLIMESTLFFQFGYFSFYIPLKDSTINDYLQISVFS